MNAPYVYEIRIEGLLRGRWSEWFEDLTISHENDRETTLKGLLVDQAALFGVLNRIHNLNLTLISVSRIPLTDKPGERKSVA